MSNSKEKNSKIIVLSLPRSGSSLITQLIVSANFKFSLFSKDKESFAAHEFNKYGYFEDVPFTLLNDQLIRLYFGFEYSFLYPPSFEEFLEVALMQKDKYPNGFFYDVDEKNVFIPGNFIENIEDFTGTNWDVWGITRMIGGGKWEKCYSKDNIESKAKILKQKEFYRKRIESSDFNFVLKDPRLALIMPVYNLEGIKIVYIRRKEESVLKSMRKHYGPRIFSKNYIPKTKYVSNHFNHKVQFMSFNEYCDRYEKAIGYSLLRYSHLILEFEDLISLKNIKKLEDFIGAGVDRSIIDKQTTIS